MKFPPLDPGKPVTNKQLAEQGVQLHGCLHNVGERVDRVAGDLRDFRQASDSRHGVLGERIARIEGALGVDPNRDRQHRTLAGTKPWKAILAVAGAMSGVLVAYQTFVPWLIDSVVRLHQAIMGG
jgi:hypothetical protein